MSASHPEDTGTPELSTRRLVLEALAPAHAGVAYAPFAEPGLYQYMTGQPPADVVSLRDEFARLRRGSGRAGERWYNWLAFRRVDHALTGWQQATVTSDGASIAWVTFPDHRRHGYAREGAQAVIDWLHSHGVRTIEAQSDERNVASCRTAEALGFVPDPEPIAETLHGEATVDRVYRMRR